jgi:hypothetical protein
MSEKRWTGGRAVEFAGNEMKLRLIFAESQKQLLLQRARSGQGRGVSEKVSEEHGEKPVKRGRKQQLFVLSSSLLLFFTFRCKHLLEQEGNNRHQTPDTRHQTPDTRTKVP